MNIKQEGGIDSQFVTVNLSQSWSISHDRRTRTRHNITFST